MTPGVQEAHIDRHSPKFVSGAAETRVITANHGLDAIEHPLGDARATNVRARDLEHALIHGQIVVPGGNDKVHSRNTAFVVDAVVMNQRTTRCLGYANSAVLVTACPRYAPTEYGAELRRAAPTDSSHFA